MLLMVYRHEQFNLTYCMYKTLSQLLPAASSAFSSLLRPSVSCSTKLTYKFGHNQPFHQELCILTWLWCCLSGQLEARDRRPVGSRCLPIGYHRSDLASLSGPWRVLTRSTSSNSSSGQHTSEWPVGSRSRALDASSMKNEGPNLGQRARCMSNAVLPPATHCALLHVDICCAQSPQAHTAVSSQCRDPLAVCKQHHLMLEHAAGCTMQTQPTPPNRAACDAAAKGPALAWPLHRWQQHGNRRQGLAATPAAAGTVVLAVAAAAATWQTRRLTTTFCASENRLCGSLLIAAHCI